MQHYNQGYDELYHYGKLGMKWGHRKNTSVKNQKPHSRRVEDLSDDELRRTINRIQMEKQYTQLTTPVNVNKGKEFMGKILKAGVTMAAVTSTALTLYSNTGKIKDIIEKKLAK